MSIIALKETKGETYRVKFVKKPELRVIHSIHLGFQADPERFPGHGGTDGYFRLFGEGGGVAFLKSIFANTTYEFNKFESSLQIHA